MTDERVRCVICQRNDPEDGWTVCRGDLNRIDDDLARILELTRIAADQLVAETRTGNGGTRPVPASRPPLDLAALDAALGLDAWPVLEEWEKTIRDLNGLSPYGAATAPQGATLLGTVTFLRSWLLWAAETPSWPIDDLAREVHDQMRYLERFDPMREVSDMSRLKCPGDHPDADGRRCHNIILFDREHPTQDIYCRRCATTWNGSRLLLLALTDETQTIWRQPHEIEAMIGVKKRTLQRWGEACIVARKGTHYDIGAAFRTKMAS